VKLVNSLAYVSSEAADSYEAVATEYYDEQLHPTCADFRSASFIYLKRLFDRCKPEGRIADVGCGRSLVAEFCHKNLVLIDESAMMLGQNQFAFEQRLLNVEQEPIGAFEFDWIFAVLGDPYNSPSAWKNIARALKPGGRCVFIVPSIAWASKFRSAVVDEKPGLARFVTSNGKVVFLRSLIFEPSQQIKMISDVELSVTSTEHVILGELPFVRSPKIHKMLAANQNLLDVYIARRFQ
jgi:SAM-dependent methyltransferase